MAALPLTGHALHKAEMEYRGKFGHTLGRIQKIDLGPVLLGILPKGGGELLCASPQHLLHDHPMMPGLTHVNPILDPPHINPSTKIIFMVRTLFIFIH